MRTLNLKSLIPLSLITLSILAPTLSFAGDGTNGGGGGGAIVCEGEQPTLTDFWEVTHNDLSSRPLTLSRGLAREQLKELRKLNETEAAYFIASRLNLFFGFHMENELRESLLQLDANVKKAITTNSPVVWHPKRTAEGFERRAIVDRNILDPKDSGSISFTDYDLYSKRCHEVRVAVSTDTSTTIREPEVLMAMAPIDRMALIFDHEYLMAMTNGRVSFADIVANKTMTSMDVRSLHAFIILSSLQKFISTISYRPEDSLELGCKVISNDEKRTRMDLIVYLDRTKDRAVMAIRAFDIGFVGYSTYATFPFDLKVKPSANMSVTKPIVQIVPSMMTGASVQPQETGFTVRLERERTESLSGSLILSLSRKATNEEFFRGHLDCRGTL